MFVSHVFKLNLRLAMGFCHCMLSSWDYEFDRELVLNNDLGNNTHHHHHPSHPQTFGVSCNIELSLYLGGVAFFQCHHHPQTHSLSFDVNDVFVSHHLRNMMGTVLLCVLRRQIILILKVMVMGLR